ncbi:hypothetical protein MUP59_10870, partial [Candidatus Bathyarchaeota archaeon]|nr:hypothetical protein [Candidatus Bathyarchaeota archaeon]
MIEILEAYMKKGRVYLPEPGRSMELLERGFGTRRGNRLDLSPYEAFFLTEKARIKVVKESNGTPLTLHDLVSAFSKGK